MAQFNIDVPQELKKMPAAADARQLALWEHRVIQLLTPHYAQFTPFPQYFRIQGLNFQILRQLLPEYFSQRYGTVLELGCGVGLHSLFLCPHAEKLVGMDIPGNYIDYTPKGFRSSAEAAAALVNGCFEVRSAEFRNAFPHETGMPDRSVDLVFSWCLVEHVPDLPKMFAEMARIVKPGGLMIHIAPQIMAGLDTLIHANLAQQETRLKPRQVLGREPFQHGLKIPRCHSEFLTDYGDQLRLYLSDTFMFPILEAGFAAERILWLRDFNTALVVRKYAD